MVDLGGFGELFPWNAALLRCIGFHEAAIHRQMLAPHQSHFHTLLHDLFEQLLEQFRFLKPPMPVFREGGVMRNLLIETEARKPAPRQMHAQFLHQLAFAADAVEIADQENAQQELGIERRATHFAVALLQPLAHKCKADVFLDQPQQMVLGNLIFQAEIVEQRFGAVVLPHHDQQSSDDENQTEHGPMPSSNTLLLNLILLIEVTFSTPTGDYTNWEPPNQRPESGRADC